MSTIQMSCCGILWDSFCSAMPAGFPALLVLLLLQQLHLQHVRARRGAGLQESNAPNWYCFLDQRDYICEYCARAFKSSHNLAVHRMIHTGEKPLQ